MPIPLSKIKAVAERERMKKMLREWYGERDGKLEINAHDTPAKLLDELNKEFMQQSIPSNVRWQIELASRWREIVSPQFAALVNFSSLGEDGTVYLEVRHSAFLQEELLKSADLMINRINSELGSDICKSIKFVPSGRSSFIRKNFSGNQNETNR